MTWSCAKITVNKELEFSVQSILIAGNNTQIVKINRIDDGQVVHGASIQVCQGVECFNFVENIEGEYENGDTAFHVNPGSTYLLKINIEGKDITSSTTIPSPMQWANTTEVIIVIDPAAPNEATFSAIWSSDLPETYVLSFVENEENDLSIPYSIPTIDFNTVFGNPTNSNFISLKANFFHTYGSYTFNVYAIDPDYEEVFFYNPQLQQNNPPEGPDNIDGAKGFFTSANRLSIVLNVN